MRIDSRRAPQAAIAVALAVGVLLLLGIAGGSATSTAAAQGKGAFGFNEDAIPMAQHVGRVKQANARIARVPVHIWVVRNQGWGRFDRAYRALRRNGVRPMMALSGSVQGMSPRQWRNFNRAFARRYASRAALQILNETNNPVFGSLRPKRYARIVKQAERAIRRVRPRATVIASAPAPRTAYKNPHQRAARYTRNVFRHIGPRRRIQPAANIFPYSKQRPIREAKQALRAVRRGVRKASRARPVWVTETAMRGTIFGIGQERARKSARLLRVLRRMGARSVIFHRLIDTPMRPGVMDTEGALDRNGNPTSLFWALRRAARR
jgi:hypothetical protein